MLMRVALVYVLAVVTAVMAFALYWQEGRLSEIQDAYLKSSNELAAKTAELDALRQKKTATEERAFFAEERLREATSQQTGAAQQMDQAKRIRDEAETALTRAQAQIRTETQAKTAAETRNMELEGKLERALSELETIKAVKLKTSVAPSGPDRKPDPVTARAEPVTPPATQPIPQPVTQPITQPVTQPITQKVLIEPDPQATAKPPPSLPPVQEPPTTTEAITPGSAGDKAAAVPDGPESGQEANDASDGQSISSKPKSASPTAKPSPAQKPEARRKPRSASATKRKSKPASQSEFFFPF